MKVLGLEGLHVHLGMTKQYGSNAKAIDQFLTPDSNALVDHLGVLPPPCVSDIELWCLRGSLLHSG